jgi:predicted transcriptional regulator of viral defense system
MPRTRMDELYILAEENEGFFTSKEARDLGIQDSVLARLAQRGRLERMSRGVYRVAHFPTDRLAQYREAVLWAQANHHGPERIALSHETAMLIYGISDLNPSRVHLTVPKSARFRRERPDWITIHQADLTDKEVGQHEGIPVTTVARSILDVLSTTRRTDVVREAIKQALREGLLNSVEATGLRKIVKTGGDPSPSSTNQRRMAGYDAATS